MSRERVRKRCLIVDQCGLCRGSEKAIYEGYEALIMNAQHTHEHGHTVTNATRQLLSSGHAVPLLLSNLNADSAISFMLHDNSML